MPGRSGTMRRLVFSATALAIAGVLALGASSALAGGPPVGNTTDHLDNVPNVFVDVHPCTGQPAQVSSLETGVIHFLAFADGTVRITGTLHGVFTADLLPVDGTPDATGTYTVWFGSNGAFTETGDVFGKAVTTFTLNGQLTNVDGSSNSFHVVAHALFDEDGSPKLEFFKAHCN
jgi:hypothetical protein